MFFDTLAFAMAQPQGGGGAQNPIMAFMPLIILFAIFYFLLIRPQQKKAKQHREMLESLRIGDKVLTSGGLYGRIVSINGDEIVLEVADKVNVKVNRNYIAGLLSNRRASSKEQK